MSMIENMKSIVKSRNELENENVSGDGILKRKIVVDNSWANIFRIDNYKPGVYKLNSITKPVVPGQQDKHKKDDVVYTLTHFLDKFEVKEKIYGTALADTNRTWNTFKHRLSKNKPFGIGMVGDKGTGKTDMSTLLANKAIDDGWVVVLITQVQPTMKLLTFLEELDNAFLLFDEFGKNFNIDWQDKMLTMLNNLNGKKKFVAFTENNMSAISYLIQDRPGRVYYLLEFGRTEEDVLRDYCKDKGVSKEFTEELVVKLRGKLQFSFDMMEAIVDEHLLYPKDSFEELIRFLNLKSLKRISHIKVLSVVKETLEENGEIKTEEFDFKSSSSKPLTSDQFFKHGYTVWLYITKKITEEEKNKAINATNDATPRIPGMFNSNFANNPRTEIQLSKKDIILLQDIEDNEKRAILDNGEYKVIIETVTK